MFEWFAAFAVFLETDFAIAIAAALVAALLLLRRRVALLVALALLLVLLPSLKLAYHDARPCALTPGLVDCPTDGGLPSGHAASFGVLAFAAIGSPLFFVFGLLAALVAYSRIFLGVHSVQQVGAGVALAMVLYVIGLRIRHEFHKPVRFDSAWKADWNGKRELQRKLFHAVFGLAIVVFGVLFGRDALVVLLLVGVAALLSIMTLLMSGWRIPVISELFYRLERDVELPGKGAFYFVIGSLLAVGFAFGYEFALAVIAILAVGDGAASIVGRKFGVHRVHWNNSKSFAGSAAFFVAGAVVGFVFLGLPGVALAFVLAVVESLPLGIDDNLLIPVAALALEFAAHAL